MRNILKRSVSMLLVLIMLCGTFPFNVFAANMSLSTTGSNFIKSKEGCVLTAYKLSGETYYTIGYGHYGADVTAGMTITQAQADQLFVQDIAPRVNAVNSFLSKYGVSVTQGQFDALVSLQYNTGYGWQSSGVATIVKNGPSNYSATEIRNAFTSCCVNVAANLKQGLINRRNAEADMFLKDTSTNTNPTPTISGANSPGTLTVGNVFSITGTVSAGATITNVTVGCYDVNGNMKTGKSANPNSTSYNIKNLDPYVYFNNLTPGVYKYKVTAATSAGTTSLVDKAFIVLAKEATVANGTYHLQAAVRTTFSVGIQNDSTAERGSAQLVQTEDKASQAFYVKHVGGGYYTLCNVASGYYLDVQGGGSASGTNVQQYSSNGSNAQQWQILPAGNGAYCLVPRCGTANCLDMYGGNIAAGTNIAVYAANLSNAQLFKLQSAKGSSQKGNKITFDTNGGSIAGAKLSYGITGYNKDRGSAELIIFNVSKMTVTTNIYGAEAAVDSTGKVTQVRKYGDENRLTVPAGGFVVSGQQDGSYPSCGADFTWDLAVGDYVYCDYKNDKVYAYSTYKAYLAAAKYVKSGSTYGDLPTPTRSGYTFQGWYTAKEDGSKVTSGTTYSVNKLYARWNAEGLDAPKTVKAVLTGHDDVKVSWSAVDGADGYVVHYKKASADSYTKLKTTTSRSCFVKDLADGTKYTFRVSAYSIKNGEKKASPNKKTASVTTLKKVGTPKVAKKSSVETKVSWTAVSGADGYQVSCSTSKTKTSSVGHTTKTSKVLEVERGKTLYYKVRAYKTVGDKKIYGPWSSVKGYKLLHVYAVKDAKAVLYGHDDVKVTWKKASGANKYAVYYKKASADSYTYLGKTTGTSYKKKNLADGVKYTFKVVPQYVVDGEVKMKGTADTASVTTLKKVSTPKVSKYSSKKVKVSWTNIAGETGYQISRSTSKTKTNVIATYKTTDGKSKTFTTTKGKTYYYKVRAYKTVSGKKIYGPWSDVKKYKLK